MNSTLTTQCSSPVPRPVLCLLDPAARAPQGTRQKPGTAETLVVRLTQMSKLTDSDES